MPCKSYYLFSAYIRKLQATIQLNCHEGSQGPLLRRVVYLSTVYSTENLQVFTLCGHKTVRMTRPLIAAVLEVFFMPWLIFK